MNGMIYLKCKKICTCFSYKKMSKRQNTLNCVAQDDQDEQEERKIEMG
jgi:hypothetical protein